MLGLTPSLFAQTTLLSEDFESGVLPANWTRSQAANSVGWLFGTPAQMSSSFFSISTTNTTKIACSNDDKYDNSSATLNNASIDRLITPALDFSAHTTIFLVFGSFQTGEYGSSGTVEISIDGGATWTHVFTVPKAQQWRDILINLSLFNTSNNVLIAFRHNDGGFWADGFAIDNVRIFEPAAYDAGVTALTMNSYYPVGAVNVTGLTPDSLGVSVLFPGWRSAGYRQSDGHRGASGRQLLLYPSCGGQPHTSHRV